jgi:hypothetical protein
MKRMLACILAVPALALLTLVGCGGGDKKPPAAPPKPAAQNGGKDDGKAAPAGAAIKPGNGKLVGRVVYEGTPPKMPEIKDIQNHADKPHCLKAPEQQKIEQTWKVAKDGGVQDVVIWLAAPKGSQFEVVESKDNVVLDQPFCVYVPHIFAVKPGQKLTIKNSADMLHNTKWEGDPELNPPRGLTIPAKKQEDNVVLKPQDEPVVFRCDIHKWMEAKAWVLPHQYVAVTGPDGKFTIDNVPTDTEVSVVAWHEGAQFFHGGKKGMKHTFKSGDNPIELKVSAK